LRLEGERLCVCVCVSLFLSLSVCVVSVLLEASEKVEHLSPGSLCRTTTKEKKRKGKRKGEIKKVEHLCPLFSSLSLSLQSLSLSRLCVVCFVFLDCEVPKHVSPGR